MRLPIPPIDAAQTRRIAAESQRDRLLFAVVTVVAEHGYAATTVTNVIAAAGVSRRTFYEQFPNIESCFFAAYDAGVTALDEIVTSAVASIPAGAGWREVVRTTLQTYLETFAVQPAFTTAVMIEILGAGPRARTRYLKTVAKFESLLRELADVIRVAEQVPHVSDASISLISGGLARFVVVETLAGRAQHLPEHTDNLVDAIVSILLGAPIQTPI